MWPVYLYIAFIPVCWLLGWAYVAYRKYHGVPANQVIDVEGVVIASIFCSLVWPGALALIILAYFGNHLWSFGGRVQDKLVIYLKNRHNKIYGESTYRQPPKVI